MSLSPKSFLYEQDAATGVATITLNRPEARNALSPEVAARLADAWVAVRDDELIAPICEAIQAVRQRTRP